MPGMPAWFRPFAKGCAEGLEKGRQGALADAEALARFIQSRAIPEDPADEGVTAGHFLGCGSIVEHIQMMRRGFPLHDDSCPACQWLAERARGRVEPMGGEK